MSLPDTKGSFIITSNYEYALGPVYRELSPSDFVSIWCDGSMTYRDRGARSGGATLVCARELRKQQCSNTLRYNYKNIEARVLSIIPKVQFKANVDTSEIYKDNSKVEAVIYDGLTVECCRQHNAKFILRGIRYVNDFEYEKAIADMNRSLEEDIETIFFTCLPQYTSVASTLVRDVLKNGGDVSRFLPNAVNVTIKRNGADK